MEKNFCLSLTWRQKGQSEGSRGSAARVGAAGRSPLTFSSSNWSPPKAETQGLIPPVPKAMRISPIMDRALQRTVTVRTEAAQTEPRRGFTHADNPGHLHVDICVSHCGNGADGFHHMADDVDDGQVDDGPVGGRRRLLRDAASLVPVSRVR